MKLTSKKYLQYTVLVIVLFIVPVLLYLLISIDPIIGFDEYGDPMRIGLYVVLGLYWTAAYFIHKYYSEAQQSKLKIDELKKREEEQKDTPLMNISHERIVLKYDANGKCIEERHIDGDENEDDTDVDEEEFNWDSMWVNKYDDNGKLVEELHYSDLNANNLISKTIFKYDTNGNLIEQTEKNSDGELEFRAECEYDQNNLLTRLRRYNKFNILRDEETYIYDKLGHCVEENIHYFYVYHKEKKETVHEHDDYSRNELFIPKDDKVFKKYDSNGKCIERIFYKSYNENKKNTFSDKTEFSYDKKGNLKEERRFKEDGSIEKVIYYQYDSKGRSILEIEESKYIFPKITVKSIEHIDDRGQRI